MKFGKNICVQQQQNPHLRYIDFKALKKIIKEKLIGEDGLSGFDEFLQSEIDYVNECFEEEVGRILYEIASEGGYEKRKCEEVEWYEEPSEPDIKAEGDESSCMRAAAPERTCFDKKGVGKSSRLKKLRRAKSCPRDGPQKDIPLESREGYLIEKDVENMNVNVNRAEEPESTIAIPESTEVTSVDCVERRLIAAIEAIDSLRKFAVWNAVAVVKILKKRRKNYGNQAGAVFGDFGNERRQWLERQAFFNGQDFATLQAAVESMAQQLICPKRREVEDDDNNNNNTTVVKQQRPARHDSSAAALDAASHPGSEAGQDTLQRLNSDLCPICLEPQVDTIELDCGHSFCWKCFVLGPICHAQQDYRLEKCPICRKDEKLNKNEEEEESPEVVKCETMLSRFMRTYLPNIKNRGGGGNAMMKRSVNADDVYDPLGGEATPRALIQPKSGDDMAKDLMRIVMLLRHTKDEKSSSFFHLVHNQPQVPSMNTIDEHKRIQQISWIALVSNPLFNVNSTFCTLCCEPLDSEAVEFLPCEHPFHQICLRRNSPSHCPLCRTEVPSGWYVSALREGKSSESEGDDNSRGSMLQQAHMSNGRPFGGHMNDDDSTATRQGCSDDACATTRQATRQASRSTQGLNTSKEGGKQLALSEQRVVLPYGESPSQGSTRANATATASKGNSNNTLSHSRYKTGPGVNAAPPPIGRPQMHGPYDNDNTRGGSHVAAYDLQGWHPFSSLGGGPHFGAPMMNSTIPTCDEYASFPTNTLFYAHNKSDNCDSYPPKPAPPLAVGWTRHTSGHPAREHHSGGLISASSSASASAKASFMNKSCAGVNYYDYPRGLPFFNNGGPPDRIPIPSSYLLSRWGEDTYSPYLPVRCALSSPSSATPQQNSPQCRRPSQNTLANVGVDGGLTSANVEDKHPRASSGASSDYSFVTCHNDMIGGGNVKGGKDKDETTMMMDTSHQRFSAGDSRLPKDSAKSSRRLKKDMGGKSNNSNNKARTNNKSNEYGKKKGKSGGHANEKGNDQGRLTTATVDQLRREPTFSTAGSRGSSPKRLKTGGNEDSSLQPHQPQASSCDAGSVTTMGVATTILLSSPAYTAQLLSYIGSELDSDLEVKNEILGPCGTIPLFAID